MSDVASALRELAEPCAFGDRVKTAIDRAARRAGLTYWRAFDIWYSKARRIEQFERDQINEALEQKRREAVRNELHELRTRLAILEARLAQSDADFHRPTTDQVREQISRLGGGYRTAAKPA